MPAKDMTNKVFGFLTIISRGTNDKHGNAMWLCKCRCGKEHIALGAAMRKGATTSCGCYQRSKVTKHGMYGTRTYKTWDGMKQRCDNPQDSSYIHYGLKGITVCARWLGDNGFNNFISDMGIRPKGKTIDRIDNECGYFMENCKWSTPQEQNDNKTCCQYITHNGETLNHVQWSHRLGGSKNLVGARIRAGWDEKNAVTIFCNHKQRGLVV